MGNNFATVYSVQLHRSRLELAWKCKRYGFSVKSTKPLRLVKLSVAAPELKPITYTTQAIMKSYTASTQSTDDAKMFIYEHESGNRTDTINAQSGACGLGQSLPCSKMPCTLQDYQCQDTYFTQYAIKRYGGWEQAKQWWIEHKWW